jgi:endonuclease YncB( thermonuclease family)
MSIRPLLIVAILLFLVPVRLPAWQGNVVGISDGDTIKVLRNRQEVRIRLWGVDCPERRQDFGDRAKRRTSELAFGKTVEIQEMDRDRYGRTVAIVILPDGLILNEALVGDGLAWVHLKYCNRPEKCAKWQDLERSARSRMLGLWSMPNPVAPWEFRRAAHKRKRAIRFFPDG